MSDAMTTPPDPDYARYGCPACQFRGTDLCSDQCRWWPTLTAEEQSVVIGAAWDGKRVLIIEHRRPLPVKQNWQGPVADRDWINTGGEAA